MSKNVLQELETLKAQYLENRQTLKEKLSIYAHGEEPLYILNQLKYEDARIKDIEIEIDNLHKCNKLDLTAKSVDHERTEVGTNVSSEYDTHLFINKKDGYGVNFDWVTIPAGEFVFGETRANQNLKYPRCIYLPEYQIARAPVTNIQYKEFIDATGYKEPKYWKGGKIPKGKEHHPVVHLSQKDVQIFCVWAGVYLPTEIEWEKAARGTEGGIYPWGTDLPDNTFCNFDKNIGDTTAVGDYPKGISPYGVLDMAGNVSELTHAESILYPEQNESRHENIGWRTPRVFRGGSFRSNAQTVRCACRKYPVPILPISWYNDVGFRVLIYTQDID